MMIFVQLRKRHLPQRDNQAASSVKPIKVGVNHGIFHIYHFWNFLIFKCTWVYSSSSSKNKHIFLNLSINSINSKMSIYLSISKMCSSLFSRENQTFARIANAKRTTQSRDATLSAITDIDYQSPLCTMCRGKLGNGEHLSSWAYKCNIHAWFEKSSIQPQSTS